MQKWEYYTHVILSGHGGPYPITEECNRLGDEGWELVCALPEAEDTYATLIFKRLEE